MKICKVDGCNNKHKAKGFCSKHYARFRLYGSPFVVKKPQEYHGMSRSKEYTTWVDMVKRCTNSNSKNYYRYGGRGITVCDRWRYSFKAFYEDMGSKPFPKAELDRENNDGNYEPNNCRWTTHLVNMRNNSNSKITMELARDIRRKYATGRYTYKQLSLEYKTHTYNIRRIINNRRWIENPEGEYVNPMNYIGKF